MTDRRRAAARRVRKIASKLRSRGKLGGWDRTRLDGRHGAAIWCGHGVFAHNLAKIGALASPRIWSRWPGPPVLHLLCTVRQRSLHRGGLGWGLDRWLWRNDVIWACGRQQR